MSIERRDAGFVASERDTEYAVARVISIEPRLAGIRPGDRDGMVSVLSRSVDIELVVSEEN